MDKESAKIYAAMGFTHFVIAKSPDPRQPDGYKAVKQDEKTGKFVDENGQAYDKAEPLPQ